MIQSEVSIIPSAQFLLPNAPEKQICDLWY